MKAGRPSKLLRQVEDTQEISGVYFEIDSKRYKEIKHYIVEHNITIKELMSKALYE